jgi:hypothetical protein
MKLCELLVGGGGGGGSMAVGDVVKGMLSSAVLLIGFIPYFPKPILVMFQVRFVTPSKRCC